MIEPVYALTMEDTLLKFERACERYDRHEITIAKLIVMLEHYNEENRRYPIDLEYPFDGHMI